MVHVIVTAAGSSKRMKGIDKLLFPIKGKPLLYWALTNFVNLVLIDTITLVVNRNKLLSVRRLVKSWQLAKIIRLVPGGATRQESVGNGLKEISKYAADNDVILVHDGARPLISPEDIKRVLKAISKSNAAILAVLVKETVKRADQKLKVTKTVKRDNLWLAQTPQGATLKTFKKVFQFALRKQTRCTDESGLFEQAGIPVKIVEGSYTNIKITTWEDLEIVGRLL